MPNKGTNTLICTQICLPVHQSLRTGYPVRKEVYIIPYLSRRIAECIFHIYQYLYMGSSDDNIKFDNVLFTEVVYNNV